MRLNRRDDGSTIGPAPGEAPMITAMGYVLAAGGNSHGQLGDGTNDSRLDYDVIETPGVLMTGIAAGAVHSLAVSVDGTVWSWGENERGQLGDATTNDRALPAKVVEPSVWQNDKVVQHSPIEGAIAVAVGSRHSLALLADGTVLGWGANGSGQLGDGTTEDRSTAGKVVGPDGSAWLRDVIAIAAGHASSAALRADGAVWTWGNNDHGELGDGTRETRLRPVPTGITRAIEIAARGTHMLALIADGTVRAWGTNSHGELGDNSAINRVVPVTVKEHPGGATLIDVIAVACGVGFSLALRADGRVWAWGHNKKNQLGDGTAHTRLTPVPVLTEDGQLTGITSISAGAVHALAIQGANRVFGWGWNNGGRLGDGTTIDRPLAVHITKKHHFGVVGVSAGLIHSLLIRIVADVRAWGANDKGQLAADAGGASVYVTAPFAKEQQTDVHNHGWVAGGEAHSAVLLPGSPQSTEASKLFTWGANGNGQLGDGGTADRSAPLPVSLVDVKAIAAGARHTLALATDGTVWAWGANGRGQLGIGNTDDQALPVKVIDGDRPLSHIKAIAARGHKGLALRSDGTIWAWGANDRGPLGDGTTTDRHHAVQMKAQSFAKDIAAGGRHTLALRSDGTVWACGAGDRGQLGQGAKQDSASPLAVQEPEDGALDPGEAWRLKSVAGGGEHSLALRADGTVWAWGANDRGQLGDTTITDSALPVRVASAERTAQVLRGVTAIAAGNLHSMSVSAMGPGIEDGGFVRCWGANDEGQLGDGTTEDKSAAVPAWPEHGGALRQVSSIAAGGRQSLAIAPLSYVEFDKVMRDNTAVRERIRWEVADGAPKSVQYDDWSPEMQAELRDAYQSLLEGTSLGIVDPPPLAFVPSGDEYPMTRLAKDVAWRIYIGHVAQSLMIEATHAVKWSLADLDQKSLRELFDSRFFFKWDAEDASYNINGAHGSATPGDPVFVYDFIAHHDLIGPTRMRTIERVLEWGREKLKHMGGTAAQAWNFQDHWQYTGDPPIRRILEGTWHPNYLSDHVRHWTAGCHGTVGFLRGVLRTVNIPVGYVYAAGHGQPRFLHEDLYIPHGDDVYSSEVKAKPPVPFLGCSLMRPRTRHGLARTSISRPLKPTSAASRRISRSSI